MRERPSGETWGRCMRGRSADVDVVLGDRRLRVDWNRRLLERALVRDRLDERNCKIQTRRRCSGKLAEALDLPLLGLWHHQEHGVEVSTVAADDLQRERRGVSGLRSRRVVSGLRWRCAVTEQPPRTRCAAVTAATAREQQQPYHPHVRVVWPELRTMSRRPRLRTAGMCRVARSSAGASTPLCATASGRERREACMRAIVDGCEVTAIRHLSPPL